MRILYTQTEIYVGIECDDSRPKGVVATELRRDIPQGDNPPVFDDYFEILIDPTNDRRNGYVFQVNPLGTQLDGTVTEESQTVDTGWDGVWTSAARITKSGWTATIGIPFTTLNFSHSRNIIWGVNFLRFIRRKNKTDLWAAWQRAFGIYKISQEGEITGIHDIGSGRLFFVRPYGLLGSDRLAGLRGTQPLDTGGVDVKYGIRSNLVANLTVNTDFSEADVNQEQFNLTPYKLFFPKTRQFFLENADGSKTTPSEMDIPVRTCLRRGDWIESGQSGKFIRLSRSATRGLDRREPNRGSLFSHTSQMSRFSNAVWSHSIPMSLSPSPV